MTQSLHIKLETSNQKLNISTVLPLGLKHFEMLFKQHKIKCKYTSFSEWYFKFIVLYSLISKKKIKNQDYTSF